MNQYLKYIWSNKNYRLSIYLSGFTLLWLASGSFFGSAEELADPAVTTGTKKQEVLVKARYIIAQDYAAVTHIRSRTQANRKVSLMAEVEGRVVSLPAAEGHLVEKGDVVCELALEDRQLRFQQAQSAVAQAQLEYDGSLKLKSGGYQSRTAIAAAKAKLDSALADLRSRELDLANTKVRAPFAGLIERHAIDEGAFVKRGQECATLIDLDPLVVTGRVSEKEVDGLNRGLQAWVSLLSKELVKGRVSLVGSEADETTRTFLVEVEVDNHDYRLRSGISADVVVGTGSIKAHLLSPALLSLDDSGRLGLRILDEKLRVEFVLVELVGDHKQGVWVTGLPEQSLLITLGQEYVSHGETVAVELENALVDVAPVVDSTLVDKPTVDAPIESAESTQR